MKIKDGFEMTQVNKDYYIVKAVGPRAEEFPQAIQLGFSGAFLWDQLSKGDYTVTELVLMLDHLFEAETPVEQLTRDVETFINFLRQYNLLESE